MQKQHNTYALPLPKIIQTTYAYIKSLFQPNPPWFWIYFEITIIFPRSWIQAVYDNSIIICIFIRGSDSQNIIPNWSILFDVFMVFRSMEQGWVIIHISYLNFKRANTFQRRIASICCLQGDTNETAVFSFTIKNLQVGKKYLLHFFTYINYISIYQPEKRKINKHY